MLLTAAGDQVPEIPLVDVTGNIGATEPLQMGVIALKVGSTVGFTVTLSVVPEAHWPTFGVKV